MGYLFQINEENVRSFHINTSLDTGFTYLYYMMGYSYNSKSYPENAVGLANGYSTSSYSHYAEVATKFLDRVITTDDIPILINADATISYEVDTQHVLKFSKEASFSKSPTEIFPIAVRYISKDGTYFIERPPSQINIDFRNGIKAGANFPEKIWIPWTLMVINPADLSRPKLFFSSKSLQDNKSRYIPSLLPNTYADGALCFSASINDVLFEHNKQTKSDIRWLFSSMFNEFISGGWNVDLFPNFSFLYSFNDLSEEVQKEYPMILKFFSVTSNEIVKANPNIRKNSINGLVQTKGKYSSRFNQFKYMFLAMSTFTLEETLAFYAEIESINVKHLISDVLSFENIVKYSDDTSKPSSTFHNLQNTISSVFIENNIPMNDTILNQQNKIFIILHNYSKDKNFNSHMRRELHSLKNYIADKIDLKVYFDILNDSMKRSDYSRHVYIWDYDNRTFEYHEDTMLLNVNSFYYDFVRDIYSIPLQDWNNLTNDTKNNTLEMEA